LLGMPRMPFCGSVDVDMETVGRLNGDPIMLLCGADVGL
jgi:hypothetical protein